MYLKSTYCHVQSKKVAPQMESAMAVPNDLILVCISGKLMTALLSQTHPDTFVQNIPIICVPFFSFSVIVLGHSNKTTKDSNYGMGYHQKKTM